jgi:hypothetical protein
MKVIFTVSLFIFCFNTNGQNETTKWYFGKFAALDFSTNPPTSLNNSSMTTQEGCASIADPNTGNLLFYTDGITIWNKNHLPMANGTGLMGNFSTTQSAIIVKQPGNSNIYFVITVDLQGSSNGLRYSVVDMSLVTGTGSVTIKNTLLYAPSTEKVTGVRHCNGTDIWIVSHEFNTDNFRSYLLTSAGMSMTPVISQVGSVHGVSGQGYMRVSSNGKKLACAKSNGSPSELELYDFDPATGIVSNYIMISNSVGNFWGCEFSPDNTKLYGGTINPGGLYQWDICAGSSTAIISSSVIITTSVVLPCLQNAPDGKIYCAKWTGTTLGVINDPNLPGILCNFNPNGVTLTTGSVTTGLPNFVTSYFKALPPPFTHTMTPQISCNTVTFSAPSVSSSGCFTSSISGYHWNFGDIASGSSNTSSFNNASHNFSSPGTYNVKLALQYSDCGIDTIIQPVTILPSPVIAAAHRTICIGTTASLTASGATSYTWSPGNITTSGYTANPSSSAVYTVTGTGSNSCTASKTVSVTVKSCVGIAEDVLKDPPIVLPNPSSGNFELKGTVHGALIEIYSSDGKILTTSKCTSGSEFISLGEYPDGIYILSYRVNSATFRMKMIKIN